MSVGSEVGGVTRAPRGDSAVDGPPAVSCSLCPSPLLCVKPAASKLSRPWWWPLGCLHVILHVRRRVWGLHVCKECMEFYMCAQVCVRCLHVCKECMEFCMCAQACVRCLHTCRLLILSVQHEDCVCCSLCPANINMSRMGVWNDSVFPVTINCSYQIE